MGKPEQTAMEDLGDTLCNYCTATEYGKRAFVQTPNGPVMCEGAYCTEAYQNYLERCTAAQQAPDEG